MEDSLQLIEKINRFLKPFADLIIFLFTTKIGILLLIVLLLLYFFIRISNQIRQRSLIFKSANQTKLPFVDSLAIITEEISNFFAKIISNITVLAVILFIMLAIVTISSTITSVDSFFKNEQKIKQLTQVLKNLDQSYKVAKVEIIDYNSKVDSTTVNIKFYDYAKNSYVPQNQVVKLPGKDIYFVNYVMNFQYSQIENGQNINIAIPFAVFSERLPQENAIKLNFADSLGVPFIFHRDTSDVYGISYNDYNEKLQEIIRFMNNPQEARKAGVRSQYNAAPHFVRALIKGQIFYIMVEQTGGLTLKPDL